jgi:hypothetical protein
MYAISLQATLTSSATFIVAGLGTPAIDLTFLTYNMDKVVKANLPISVLLTLLHVMVFWKQCTPPFNSPAMPKVLQLAYSLCMISCVEKVLSALLMYQLHLQIVHKSI